MIDMPEVWDCSSLPHPVVTTLFPLEPAGIGTPYVSGLAAYIAQLAIEHSISLSHLVAHIIIPELKRSYQLEETDLNPARTLSHFAQAVNGINPTTVRVIHVLEKLTGRNDLSHLTMYAWSEVIAARALMRDKHAWCAYCYEEQRLNGVIINDYLLWSLRDVRICPQHHCLLEEMCPYEDCKRRLPRLSQYYTPGFCRYCKRWLGRSSPSIPPDISEQSLDWERLEFDTKVIADLIALNPSLIEHPPLSKLTDGLKTCIEQFAGGNIYAFARQVGIAPSTLVDLIQENHLPRLQSLLTLAFRSGISLPTLMTRGEVVIVSTPRLEPKSSKKQKKYSHKSADEVQALGQEFDALLNNNPPISLREIAHRLRQGVTYLKRHFPSQCQHAVARYREFKARQADEKRDAIRYGLEEVLRCNTEPPLSVYQICANLLEHDEYLYKHHDELARAIAARFMAYQSRKAKARVEALCERARQAVYTLHRQGIYPSLTKVIREAGIGAAIMIPEVRTARKAALRELGYLNDK